MLTRLQGVLPVPALLDGGRNGGLEWAHRGQPVEDLAWCEWIIRMHHGAHVGALDQFFDAYGLRPSWDQRRAAMLAQCERLLDLCRRWNVDAVRRWQHRLAVTAGWIE